MSESMRITDHPILGADGERKSVTIYFEGQAVPAYEGEPIAAALTGAGIKVYRNTEKTHEPRGLYCAMGRCNDCMMVVDGEANVRTCITPVKDGMQIRRQHGLE